MKTLKKTLCLVLALVMVVGTLAFAASADVAKPVDNFANYKDAETAKASAYAEAIDVNLGLGIIKGVSKTEIKIDGTLTRAQAAKIVCYLLLGEDIAEKLAPASSFDDVAETMWASKYIAYAASEGILNGKGNNKFDPNGEVTGYEFEKILLNALDFGFTNIQNYDPITGDVVPGKKNNYTGSNWKTKVSLDAADVELGYGAYGYGTALEGADLNKALTRAEAMELVFDALIINILDGIGTLKYYFEPNHTEHTDAYGRPLIVWAADDKNISGSYLYPSTFTLTFVDVDIYGQDAEDAIDAYNKENGTEYDYGAVAGNTFYRGQTVEFYVEDDVILYYVRYWYELDKITKVNDDGTVESAYGYYDTWDPDHPVVIEGAKKDDIYRIPYALNAEVDDFVVEDAEKVEPDFTSKITAYANYGFDVTANGAVQYLDGMYNWAIGAELAGVSYGDFKNEFDFYLSPAGTLLAAIQVTEVSTEPDYLYGFAIAYQVKSATSSTTTTDLFGSQTTGTDAPAMAKIVVVTPDAETKILDLAV
ncbi:MAG: S-layer homology domain-containing protein, partial [Oscillospiraceae bacterium]|nr:S-layer homology domain-containing protein [Oscillospiraceae bacterium]